MGGNSHNIRHDQSCKQIYVNLEGFYIGANTVPHMISRWDSATDIHRCSCASQTFVPQKSMASQGKLAKLGILDKDQSPVGKPLVYSYSCYFFSALMYEIVSVLPPLWHI